MKNQESRREKLKKKLSKIARKKLKRVFKE
jgi:hypothetical protein